MLGCNDGLDYVGKIVNIWEGFHAKKDIVESGLLVGGLFGALNNWTLVSSSISRGEASFVYHSEV